MFWAAPIGGRRILWPGSAVISVSVRPVGGPAVGCVFKAGGKRITDGVGPPRAISAVRQVRRGAPERVPHSSVEITRISPVAPSTSTTDPPGSRLEAPSALTTHGTPNSRATTVVLVRGPPRSVTTAAAYAKAGVYPTSVTAATRI